jgi:peroxiredoxin
MEVKVDSLSDAAKKFFGSYMDFNDDFYRSAIYRNTVSGLVYEFCERNQSNKSATLEAKYQCISKFLPPKLLPRVVAQLISLDIDKLRDKDDLERIIHRTFLNAADSNTKNYLLHKLEDVYSLKVGSSAPDFVLENQNGEKVTLASFTGKVVFMDFWFDACGPCHEQFKNLKPVKEHFKNNKEVVFLNISIDNRYNWLKGIENPNIAGMHVYTEGKESNHTVVKDYKVHGYPTNRIIGKNGNIFLAFPARNPEELINQIDDALKSK